MVVQNRLLEHRRQRIGKGLHRRLHVKGDQRGQQCLDLRGGQLRHMVVKGKGQPRANQILVVILNDGVGVRPGADFDVAKKAVFLERAAIQIKEYFCVVELDIGHGQAIAGLGAQPLAGHHVQIGFSGGLQLTVGSEG